MNRRISYVFNSIKYFSIASVVKISGNKNAVNAVIHPHCLNIS